MLYSNDFDWGGLGNLLMAIALAAMAAYLAPGMVSLSPQWRRRLNVVAGGLVAAGLIVAIAATAVWFSR